MKRIVIIGNGFDLGHNLLTTFDSFIKSNSNYTEKYEDFEGDNWNNVESNFKEILIGILEQRDGIDVEAEVKKLLDNYWCDETVTLDYCVMDSDVFTDEINEIERLVELLIELEEDFHNYLEQVCNDDILSGIKASNHIQEILSNASWIINFNYTNAVEVVYGMAAVTHIHGHLDNNDIAIGTNSLEEFKESLIDGTIPLDTPCKDKYELQESMTYLVENAEDESVPNDSTIALHNEVTSEMEKQESKLFDTIDKKNKDTLESRKEVINRLKSERFDEVYILGHSLAEADHSVLKSINKNTKVNCFFHGDRYSAEYAIMNNFLRTLGVSFELIPNGSMYEK